MKNIKLQVPTSNSSQSSNKIFRRESALLVDLLDNSFFLILNNPMNLPKFCYENTFSKIFKKIKPFLTKYLLILTLK
jgi:hypothetical protein